MIKSTDIYDVISSYFPRLNDNYHSDYVEELEELLHFRIRTTEELSHLLEKHIVEVLRRDKEASILCEQEKLLLIEEMGQKEVQVRIDRGFWFSYPALLRLALEIEFGESYLSFAQKRDGVGWINPNLER